MVKYEVLILMRPELSKEKQDEIKDSIVKLIEEEKGALISHDRWGKHLLAYPIEKCTYGIYSLIRFEITKENANALLGKMKALCAVRLGAFIMRFTIIALTGKISADYRRPDSLEDAPRREKSYGDDEGWGNHLKHNDSSVVNDFEEINSIEA